jgi:16S rRNA (cytosine1402-N4)-methyltransferase
VADKYYHKPAMLKEVLDFLKPLLGGRYLDCTLGGGGYAFAISEIIGPEGLVIGLDRDSAAIDYVKQECQKRGVNNILVFQSNFSKLDEALKSVLEGEVGEILDGIVFDLGLSSAQLSNPDYGMSFLQEGPLDMRFDRASEEETKQTAANIINRYPETRLKRLIQEYGEEKYAGRITRAIIEQRRQKPIQTTGELRELIRQAVPAAYRHGRIDAATRTFQALRIEVNRELDSLKEALPKTIQALKPGGRLVVVSYHSLEDRIVKRFLRQESRQCLCPPEAPECRCGHEQAFRLLKRKVEKPQTGEVEANPRARSARLRAAEKL